MSDAKPVDPDTKRHRLFGAIFFGASMMALGVAWGASVAGTIATATYWLMVGVILGMQGASVICSWYDHKKTMADLDAFKKTSNTRIAEMHELVRTLAEAHGAEPSRWQ